MMIPLSYKIVFLLITLLELVVKRYKTPFILGSEYTKFQIVAQIFYLTLYQCITLYRRDNMLVDFSYQIV